MPSGWERHFLLRKRLDLVSNHIDTSFVGSVEFEHTLFVCFAQQRTSKTEHRRSFADPGKSRDEQVRTVAVLLNHFEPINRVFIPHHVVQS